VPWQINVGLSTKPEELGAVMMMMMMMMMNE